ncbi:MAG: 2-C-methyl-D-erythritol 2,4-cyclodiphosphate synthase [Acidimicrobiales bacterium]
MQVRVGQGFDVHPFVDDAARPLVLGGVAFPSERALRGHSDADVIAHACADALLGAAGLGDIGQHFPDTDERWAGADSIALLAEVARMVRAAGWEPGNVDASVVTDHPKIAPARDQMQQRLADAVGAPVTVKGRRPEGLGTLGRGEGVACWAVAVVTKP